MIYTNPAIDNLSLLKLPDGGRVRGGIDYDDCSAETERPALTIVYNFAIEELGRRGISPEIVTSRLALEAFIDRYAGLTHPAIFKKLHSELGLGPLSDWDDASLAAMDKVATNRIIDAFGRGELNAAPNVDRFFSGLQAEDIDFCIVSSSPMARLQACVSGLDQARYGIPIWSARQKPLGSLDVEAPKPAGDIYSKAIGTTHPDEWIAVEDSKSGVEAAGNAGIKKVVGYVGCVAKDRQIARAQVLFKAGALIVVTDHLDTLDVFVKFKQGQFSEIVEKFGPGAWKPKFDSAQSV